jgi:hypothetical protein
MDNESLREFLDRRERELTHRVSAIQGELAQVQAELAEVGNARAALVSHKMIAEEGGEFRLDGAGASIVHHKVVSASASQTIGINQQDATAVLGGVAAKGEVGSFTRYESMTIKEMVVQALLDHFPKGGTMTEIRDFIRNAYGRTIEPSSLRPQMHRLKASEILGQDPTTDTWNFRDGKRAQYAFYTVTRGDRARAAMKELKDDEI